MLMENSRHLAKEKKKMENRRPLLYRHVLVFIRTSIHLLWHLWLQKVFLLDVQIIGVALTPLIINDLEAGWAAMFRGNRAVEEMNPTMDWPLSFCLAFQSV